MPIISLECEFWTLRLKGDKACLLLKNAGAYQGGTGHYEGLKDSDCAVTGTPTSNPTTSSMPTMKPIASPKKGIGMHTAQSCNALDNYDGRLACLVLYLPFIY